MLKMWWQSAVIYQIYPRSFQDSNSDGVGDLGGITARLDALKDLGVDALWISPITPSPMADFGYDVANYRDVDPLFGTLADFDTLVTEAHARGLKILLDFVPNHSSDQHPWFIDSRSSRHHPKRDWYIWRDAKPDGSPPNNWISDFGGPAWEWDEKTGQYYYHAFLKEQPDLNWRNHEVRRAMFDSMRFWFDRGGDGFRIDVLWHLIKDKDFKDNPANPNYRIEHGEMFKVLQTNSTDQPEIFEIVREMRRVSDEYAGRVLIGEIYLPYDRLVRYYGESLDGVQMPFNFQLIQTDWSATAIAQVITDYEAALPDGAWPNWVLGNHDRSRIATRVGPEQARVAAMLLLTLRGTPTMYYGDELGLKDVTISPERAVDPRELREPGLGLGRDPERTPMPWSAEEPYAGFSAAEPWLPLNLDWRECNLETLRAKPESLFNLYRNLLRLRKQSLVLQSGSIRIVSWRDDVLIYARAFESRTCVIALNFGTSERALDASLQGLRIEISTHDLESATTLRLRANEGLILSTPE